MIFHLKKLFMLMNGIILVISGRDTLRLSAPSLGPLQVVYIILNTITNAIEMQQNFSLLIF